jgi:predicted acyl esterase
MNRRWFGLAAWLVLIALTCSCSSSDSAQQPSDIQGGEGAGAGGSAADGSGAGGGGTSALDGGRAGAGGMGGGGGAGGSDARQDGGQQSACDPTAGGRVSSPGAYEGYSEVLYDGHAMTSQYVEVRDGTRLAMDIFRPTDGGELVTTPLPVLFMHTPYNRRTFLGGMAAETYPGFALRLVEYGYIVAVVDFRGVYASFGGNVAYNRGEWIDAARMDAYDIIEWLAAQPWSSGKVGMWGCSATGGSQLQAATTAPPHLKAIFPMSCEFDAYPFGVPGGMARAEGNTSAPPAGLTPSQRDAMAVPVDGADGAALLAQAIAEHADNVENVGYVPYRDSVAENIPEQWWLKSSPHTYLDAINASGIAIYVAANWNEGMTKYGAFFTLNNVTTPVKLVVGPAGHCEWSAVKRDAGFDLVIEERRFFDHWLKDIDNCVMDEPKVHYYTYNAAPGEEWQSAEAWPLPSEQRTRYYFGEGSLGTTAPAEPAGMDVFEVDYAVTAVNRAETGLVYATEPLAAAIQVTGHPVVELWVSSTATDGDFVVTLEDVAPDGTATSYFMNGRLRASHRALADAPYNNLDLPWHPHTEAALEPLVPGEPALLTFDLLPISIVFAEGHRIRVIVNFADVVTPVVEPAPTVTIYRDAEHASAITLPVVE